MVFPTVRQLSRPGKGATVGSRQHRRGNREVAVRIARRSLIGAISGSTALPWIARHATPRPGRPGHPRPVRSTLPRQGRGQDHVLHKPRYPDRRRHHCRVSRAPWHRGAVFPRWLGRRDLPGARRGRCRPVAGRHGRCFRPPRPVGDEGTWVAQAVPIRRCISPASYATPTRPGPPPGRLRRRSSSRPPSSAAPVGALGRSRQGSDEWPLGVFLQRQRRRRAATWHCAAP